MYNFSTILITNITRKINVHIAEYYRDYEILTTPANVNEISTLEEVLDTVNLPVVLKMGSTL